MITATILLSGVQGHTMYTLWETGGFQKALYQHVDTVT